MNRILLSLAALCCLSTSSFADVSKNQCTNDARTARFNAISTAQSTYQDALTSCKGPCFEACKTTFETCVAPFHTAAKECIAAAETAFATAISTCQTTTNCGTPKQCYINRNFQLCLVDPRVLRRTTIQACNKTESTGIKTAGCAAAKKTCNKACPTVK